MIRIDIDTATGSLMIVERDAEGRIHRRVILPGMFHDGQWTDTDLSGESPEIQAAAKQAWTPDVVASYRGMIEESRDEFSVPYDQVIETERNRRLARGFRFNGSLFDFDEVSKTRIAGAATLAGFAVIRGAQPGDYNWHGGSTPFQWIAQDNTIIKMDAQTTFAFGQAAARWETLHVFTARDLKDADPRVSDPTNDEYWPPL